MVVFGRCDEQIHLSVQIRGYEADHEGEDIVKTAAEGIESENTTDVSVLEVHYASDLAATVLERIVGFTAWYVFYIVASH